MNDNILGLPDFETWRSMKYNYHGNIGKCHIFIKPFLYIRGVYPQFHACFGKESCGQRDGEYPLFHYTFSNPNSGGAFKNCFDLDSLDDRIELQKQYKKACRAMYDGYANVLVGDSEFFK